MTRSLALHRCISDATAEAGTAPGGDLYTQWARTRHSTRAFLEQPVPDALLAKLLETARWAPSGANLQPGHFWQVRGQARMRLSAALQSAWEQQEPAVEDYDYFPRPMPMGLRKRQVAAAQALYGALGVGRDDRAGRDAQFGRNFRFFDAPVALVVTLEQAYGHGGFMDLGMCLHGLMMAAHAQGLASCAIGALASYPGQVRAALDLPAGHSVVCGLALGWADTEAPVNQTRTARAPLGDFFQVLD